MRWLRDPVYHGEYTPAQRFGIVFRLLTKGVLPGGPRRLGHFLRSVPWLSISKMPLVVVDWIAALSMRHYVEQHFGGSTETQRANLGERAERLRLALRAYIDKGAAAISLDSVAAALPRLTLALAGGLDRAFFIRAARHVRSIMKRTPSTLTLHIDAVGRGELLHLQRLLERLAPFGGRISIVLHERVLNLVRVDSSIFHLVLDGRPAAS
jgi:hypothetical protein